MKTHFVLEQPSVSEMPARTFLNLCAKRIPVERKKGIESFHFHAIDKSSIHRLFGGTFYAVKSREGRGGKGGVRAEGATRPAALINWSNES